MIHLYLNSQLCSCGLSTSYRDTLLKLTKQYQEQTKQMIENENLNDRDDFAVVVQPFMTKMTPPLSVIIRFESTYTVVLNFINQSE